MSCGAIKALTVTPDGKRLVAVSHSTMAVYDLVANQRYKYDMLIGSIGGNLGLKMEADISHFYWLLKCLFGQCGA
jgi:hypothetical protein